MKRTVFAHDSRYREAALEPKERTNKRLVWLQGGKSKGSAEKRRRRGGYVRVTCVRLKPGDSYRSFHLIFRVETRLNIWHTVSEGRRCGADGVHWGKREGWLVICTEQTAARPGNLQRQCNIREIRLDTGELAGEAKFSEAAPTILEPVVAPFVPLFATEDREEVHENEFR